MLSSLLCLRLGQSGGHRAARVRLQNGWRPGGLHAGDAALYCRWLALIIPRPLLPPILGDEGEQDRGHSLPPWWGKGRGWGIARTDGPAAGTGTAHRAAGAESGAAVHA